MKWDWELIYEMAGYEKEGPWYLDGETVIARRCHDCGELKDIEYYHKDSGRPKGYRSQCMTCQKEYINENKDKYRGYIRKAVQKRRSREAGLPTDLTDEQMEGILDRFDNKCALTGDAEIDMDHVIPIAVGHGGTTVSNYIPLKYNLNRSKNTQNIFDWFYENKERFNLEQRKFDELIEYLAEINGMTTDEYEKYVRWCHDNPRTLDEIRAEQDEDKDAS